MNVQVKPTPGPWRLTQVHTPEDDYGLWYHSIRSGKGYHDDDQQGFELTGIINPKDAHIAAAAPDLYAALKEATLALVGLAKGEGLSIPIERTIRCANAALAKARGDA